MNRVFNPRQAGVIAAKEFRSYFASPIAYLVIAVFLLIMGWIFFFNLDHVNTITLQYRAMGGKVASITDGIVNPVYSSMNVLFLFISPFITMRLFAEEKKMQTIQLLWASPVTTLELLLGKFFSAMLLVSLMMLLTAAYPAVLLKYSNVDLGPVFTSYVGLFLIASSYVSLGILFSTIAENQIAAGAATFAACMFLWLLDMASQSAGPILQVMLEYLSIIRHFRPFSRGIINTTDLVYYGSFIGLMLYLSYRSLESRQWSE